VIDAEGILRVLPHRYPFLLVDRVVDLSEQRIVALKNVSHNEPFFVGHFPGHPVMPGVLIVEALAQAGILLAHACGGFDPERHVVYFAAIDSVKFRRPVRPGDQLRLEVEPLRRGASVWKMKGVARVGEETACQAEFLATIAKRGSPDSAPRSDPG